NRQVLAHGLPGHIQAGAELSQALATLAVQTVEQQPATGVGQGSKHLVHPFSPSKHAANRLPNYRQPRSCMSRCWPPAGHMTDAAVRAFRARTGRDPEGIWSAPGRINLIGEHTDYNDGFVLPFALSLRTVVAAARRQDGMLRISSCQYPGASLVVPLEAL